jgi:hypothetical protein
MTLSTEELAYFLKNTLGHHTHIEPSPNPVKQATTPTGAVLTALPNLHVAPPPAPAQHTTYTQLRMAHLHPASRHTLPSVGTVRLGSHRSHALDRFTDYDFSMLALLARLMDKP